MTMNIILGGYLVCAMHYVIKFKFLENSERTSNFCRVKMKIDVVCSVKYTIIVTET